VRTNKFADGAVAARRRTQQERSAESAQRLLDSAIQLIAEKGFDRTTAAEIGERAGYSRSMVRARYGSKDALLESIFGSELNRRLLPEFDDGLVNGLQWVLARVDDVIRVLDDEPELMRAFCVMTFEATVIDSLRGWYSQWFQSYEAQLAAHLRIGRGDGSVDPAVDPDREAAQFVLTGIGLIFRFTLDPSGYDLDGELRAWRRRLAAGLSAR
jgi:AcrR family transcriptional regulator